MTEVWKPIPDYEGLYEVSDCGRVRSVTLSTRRKGDDPYILAQCMSTAGYKVLRLSSGVSHKNHYVHRLVLTAFVGPCPDGMQCAHGDGNRVNNSLQNLRWATTKDNANDRSVHGTTLKGDKHPLARLTNEDVATIRLLKGSATQRDLAKRFGVSQSHISDIQHRRKWGTV